MKNVTAALMLSLAFSLSAYSQKAGLKVVSSKELGAVLSCLQTKVASDGAAPPQFAPGLYRVRYYYGVLTPGDDEPDELQLVVYAPKGTSAVLYRVYLKTTDRGQEIYIGDWGTLKKEHGRMVPDEIPGGVATYFHIKKLLEVLSQRPVLTIRSSDVKPGPAACVYQP
jgi:hypothetical protein